jgi:predicted deacylase
MKIPATYEESRELFRASLAPLKQKWPSASLEQVKLKGSDLTVDWIQAPALERSERVLVITTGLHGIEAYAGVYVLQLIQQEFLPSLDEKNTGLLLVHAINPWGMKYRRRVNGDNIDLNRSFVAEGERRLNLDYERLRRLFNPLGRLHSLAWAQAVFLFKLAGALATLGAGRIKAGLLSGQYRENLGLYFGGGHTPQESRLMMRLFREAFGAYDRLLHLDMHTGYGPKNTLTLVNSMREPRSTEELRRVLGYEHIAATNPQEFYTIHGDMVEWLYRLAASEFPGKPFYSTSFEFGTLGDSLFDHVRDMFAMISENQSYHFDASEPAARVVRQRFEQLYLPDDPAWRDAVLRGARRALQGILTAEGFLPRE